jgi:DNA polymerase I
MALSRHIPYSSGMTQPHRPVGPGDHVFLVDGSSFVFRAYYQSIRQDQKYNYRSDRLPIGAVRLFSTKILQFIRDGAAGVKPTHLAIIFDKSENSFRREIYPPYKSHRPDPPADLVPQFPLMRATVRAFGMIPVEQDRYEADDLIATYARQAREKGADVLIVSADKDLMQLIEPGVAMYDPASGEAGAKGSREERRIGPAEVREYFGLGPDKVVDIQALAGDSTDNVPGAPGVGVKTAAQLIGEYGDLDTLLARANEIKQPKRREALTLPENVERIRTSKALVTLVRDVPLEIPIEALATPKLEGKELIAFFKAMELTTITRRVAEICGIEASLIEPDPRFVGPAGWQGREGEAALAKEQEEAQPEIAPGVAPSANVTTPADLVATRSSEARAPVDRMRYKTMRTIDELSAFIALAHEAGHVAIDAQMSSLDPLQADLVGVSLAVAPAEACYIPIGHRVSVDDLFSGGGLAPNQIREEDAVALLKPLMEAPGVLKIGHDVKFGVQAFAQGGIAVAPIDDTMLISYALDGGLAGVHGLDELSERFLGHKPIRLNEVTGSGRNLVGFDRVTIDRATEYAAENADLILRLWRTLKPRLAAERVTTVYETLERPLVPVLARMERRGVAIDRQMLSRLAGDFAQTMGRLEDEIAKMVGAPFNPGSPKQLGDILFGQMGLPGGKRTATGAWSTTASVLEDLAAEGHQLPARVLEWRQVSKLKSTYADALPGFVDPSTNRVHTSYALAATTTGRLSSSEPNLQNIPVRTEEGRKIRRAFVAGPGAKLISADYSQIELRLLAHIADIPALKKAFAEGLDIHAMTASEMFGVPIQGMPGEIRRRAKAINFGIIYGISAFGLANQLGIARDEAGAYIKKYFERFPGIRDYMDATKKAAHADGYVKTIFGRKCHYPRINASNVSERAFNERAAINAPIQGSAADIIRRAMIRMDGALVRAGLSARMLLTVHDELVFEAPDEEIEATLPVVTRVMVEAPEPALRLHVPLQVEGRAARNWEEAH